MEREEGGPAIELHATAVQGLARYYHPSAHGTADVEVWRRVLAAPPNVTSLRVNCLRTDVDSACRQLADHLQRAAPKTEPETTDHTGGDDAGEQPQREQARPTVHPVLRDVIILPCTGPHKREPKYPPAVVDRSCGEAVLRGAHIYAAGVIAAAGDLHKGDMVSVFVDDGKGGKTGKLTRGEFVHDSGNRLFVGNGRLTMGRGLMFSGTSGVAIEMVEQIYETPSLNGVMDDLLFLQNIPSIVVGHLLDPQPGDLILDMCAAPGGKTTHIAALANDRARIFALDKNVGKVEGVQRLCQRLGITSVTALTLDATKALLPADSAPDQLSENQKITGWPAHTFDRILLDPPCSGLGNRPRLKDTQTWSALQTHAAYQRKIIHTAVPLLKPGGTLVYSTCTISPLENEENVAFILRTFPEMELVDQVPRLGAPGLDSTSLGPAERGLVQRFDPTLDPGVTGFFVAKFVKRRTSSGL